MEWAQVRGCGNSMEFYDMLFKTLPKNAKVVEVGVFYGRGLVYLAQNSDFEVYGVDCFYAAETAHHPIEVPDDNEFYKGCLRNLFGCGVQRKVTLIALPSNRAADIFEDGSLDCVFIDGNHSYEGVAQDIALWRPKVKAGGFLSGDDYIQPWGGVVDAVNEAIPGVNVMGQQTWWTQV